MIIAFLKLSGWEIYDLGNDVLAEEFVDKAVEVGAHIIGVSAMMFSTAVNIKKVREEIDTRGYKGKIQLAVGGAIFNIRPKLLNEVGGDGSASSAINVSVLFKELQQKALTYGEF
jgi:methanogenic corrinoid protein MtbC1